MAEAKKKQADTNKDKDTDTDTEAVHDGTCIVRYAHHACIHTSKHTYIHTYIHIHIHIHMYDNQNRQELKTTTLRGWTATAPHVRRFVPRTTLPIRA